MVYSDPAWDDLRKENSDLKAELAAVKDALQTQVYHFDEAMNNENCGPWFEAVQDAKKLLKYKDPVKSELPILSFHHHKGRHNMLTRDAARAAYNAADLSFFPLSHERLVRLRRSINREMLTDALMDGTFHMKHSSTIRVHSQNCAELRCCSYYFEDREAVTFNADGFIGFAGWADDQNVQPILRGFMAWVKHEEEVAELN